MSLIESLSRDYCDSYIRGCLVNYEGKAYIINNFSATSVFLRPVRRTDDLDEVVLPHSWLDGWAKLAYPELGYRKVGRYAMFTQRRQTANRGLRMSYCHAEMTPASRIVSMQSRDGGVENAAVAEQIIAPVYDGREVLAQVLEGTAVGYVPSPDICIEASIDSPNFIVYYCTKPAGTISSDGTLNIVSPAIRTIVEEFV